MPSPLDKVLARLEEMGYTVSRNGEEYRSQCPAHHGHGKNFAFSAGDDGRLLATCHSKKCSFEEIARSLGFEPSELMGKDDDAGRQLLSNDYHYVFPKPVTSGKTVHPTLKKALSAAAFSVDTKSKPAPNVVYSYHNRDGSENLFIARWNLPGRKEIRPISRVDGGYIVGKYDGQVYPIYGIDTLARLLSESTNTTIRVYVCEGEKATECARRLGLTATCTPFGSESATKADWTTLDHTAVQNKKSLEMVILPDHDEAGEEYARSLVSLFNKFETKTAVKVVRLSEYSDTTGIEKFPVKGDICDLCDLLDGKTNEEIRQLVERMVEKSAEPEDTSLVLSLAYCSQQAFDDIVCGEPPVVWPVSDNPNSALNLLKLAPQKVIVIGGAPGVGKTAFFMQIVFDAIRLNPDLRALICNVEMDPNTLVYREYARQTGISLTKILERDVSYLDKKTLEQCRKEMADLGKRCFFLVSPFSTQRILESIERVNADLIVLDYAQRFNVSDLTNPDAKERLQYLLTMARDEIARKGRCALLASALNRSANGGKNSGDYSGAGITSFRDSSELEYSVDDAYILGYGPKKKQAKNERILYCLKKRNEAVVDIPLEFDGAHQQFFIPGESIVTGWENDFSKFSSGDF